jgi:hypothetical protein
MDRQYSIQKSGGAQIDGTPPKTPLRYLTTYRGQAVATKVTKVLYELVETRYLDPTPSFNDRQRVSEIVLHYTPMSAEHPINPEDIGRRIDGSFHIPNEQPSETSTGESESVRSEYIRKAQERVGRLAPETRTGIEHVTEQFLEVQKHSLEFANTWPDLVQDAQHIHEHIVDTYTAYKNGAIDEEELQVALNEARESFSTLRAMMDPDQRETPAE